MKLPHILCGGAFVLGALCSCSQDNDEIVTETQEYTICANAEWNNVWKTASRAFSGDTPLNNFYLFDSDGKFVIRKGDVASNANLTFNTSIKDGKENFTLYCISGIGLSKMIDFQTDQHVTQDVTMILDTLADVCIGKNQVAMSVGKYKYDVNVTVNHVMAQLGLSVNQVPATITELSVQLPKQSRSFNFKGEFLDDAETNISLTLPLKKATTPDENGNFTWTLEKQLIYPTASDATKMDILLLGSDGSNKIKFSTQYAEGCKPGTSTLLTSSWKDMDDYITGSVTVNPWEGDVEKEIDFGEGTIVK